MPAMSDVRAPEIIRNPEADTTEPQRKRPPMFRVVMLNDDFTPMDFVVEILCRYFHKSEDEATVLMMQVHQQGRAICGVFTRDIAETKIQQVETASRTSGHPLRCAMEQEPEE